MLVAPPYLPYAPAFAGLGVDLSRLIVVESRAGLRIELVSDENGEDAWVRRLEVRATIRGTSQTVSEVVESQRERRVHEATLVLDAAGDHEVTVITPGCPDQVLSVTVHLDALKRVTVRLPRVE